MNSRPRQASALILVVSAMMLLSVMGICFVRVAVMERGAALQATDMAHARLVSQAGLDYALTRLRSDFNGELVDINKEWMCWAADNPGAGARYVEDDNGVGCDRIELGVYDPLSPRLPSYAYRHGSDDYHEYPGGFRRRFSGRVGDFDRVYTLQIIDTTSQINLNSHLDPAHPGNATAADIERMARQLLNLSEAVSLRTGYVPPPAAPAVDLLEVCRNVFAKRNEWNGFASKRDLLQVPGVSAEFVQHLWDYYTVHPGPADMSTNLYRQIKRVIPGDETQFASECRSPVNVNTAPWPVLVAIFSDLEKQDASVPDPSVTRVAITQDEAIALANKICQYRRQRHFAGYDEFFAFVDAEKTAVFASDHDTKADIAKANASPSVYLRRFHVDAIVHQQVHKLDLVHYTTELCFFPYGSFEIYSLGEILEADGSVRARSEYYALATVFHLLRHKTQMEFEQSSRLAMPAGRGLSAGDLADTSCATGPRNMQNRTLGNDAEMDFFGYVEPLAQRSLLSFGSATLFNDLRFRAPFDGNLDVIDHNRLSPPQADPWFTTVQKMNTSQLVPDGVLLQPNTAFCHKATEANNVNNAGFYDANLPPREGALMLWVKFNKGSNKWKTLFCATTALVDFNTDNPRDFSGDPQEPQTWIAPTADGNVTIVQLPQALTNGLASANINGNDSVAPFEPALQFEGYNLWAAALQMKVAAKYDEASQSLTLSVKRQFLKWPCGYDDKMEIALSAGNSLISTQATVVLKPHAGAGYPVRPHHWYHIAIRWRNYADISRAPGGEPDVLVSGAFYDNNGQLLHRGPLLNPDPPGYEYKAPGNRQPRDQDMPWNEDPEYNLNESEVPSYAAFVAGFGVPDPPDPSTLPDGSYDDPDDVGSGVPTRYWSYVKDIYERLKNIVFTSPYDAAPYEYNSVRGRDNLARKLFRAASYMSTALRKSVLPLAFREVRPGHYKRMYFGDEFGVPRLDGTTFVRWNTDARDDLTEQEFASGDVSNTMTFDEFNVGRGSTIDEQEFACGLDRFLHTAWVTLDDLGIYGIANADETNQVAYTARINAIYDSTYMPGRYQPPAAPNTSRQVAVYRGRFSVPEEARLGCLYWQGRYVPDIVCDSADKGDWPKSYPQHVWDEIWSRMTDGACKPCDFTSTTLDYQASATVTVDSHSKSGSLMLNVTGEGSLTVPIAARYTAENDYAWSRAGVSLKDLLLDWYAGYATRDGLDTDPLALYHTIARRRNNGGSLADASGKPRHVSAGEGVDYNILFLASDIFYNTPYPASSPKSLFSMSVIEEVLMSYQGKTSWKEYREFR